VHVLFVHRNFPAQFGGIAARLVREREWRCTFVSETAPGTVQGVRKIQYAVRGGATRSTHYFSRTFENGVWHAAGVYEAVRPLRDELRPDLIVGHSGFGSTLFLPELFPDTPIVNYFEYFYRPRGTDMDFRPDQQPDEADFLRVRARNAMILLDLENCRAGYAPTRFQRSLFPQAYASKIRVIHDGVDTGFWRRVEVADRTVAGRALSPETRVVTYVSRGLESMRGFDLFMQVARRVCDARPDVVFLVVGSDRVAYGGDLKRIEEKTFKEHVLARDDYDLDRILFLGRVRPTELVRILSLSDLHVYLTVPFVLSWSLLNAMACRCTVLASDTAPVREVITDGNNGVLRDFFDVDGLAAAALAVLEEPVAYRDLGRAAERTVRRRYALDVTFPRLAAFFEQAAGVTDSRAPVGRHRE
jgi:glycosyltransferase involved in cell wall biosynthesis